MSSIRVAYLIPEWPGQTHIWMWREICHLRELGAEVRIYATRPPPDRDRARHAFVAQAVPDTRYLWPRRMVPLATDILSTIAKSPVGIARALTRTARLPLDTKPGWRTAAPLSLAAAEMAAMAHRDGIQHVHLASAANSAVIALALKEITGIPYSITVNTGLTGWGGALRDKFAGASLVVAHAAWVRAEICREFTELDPARVVLAPVGVDTRTWQTSERTWPDAGGNFKLVSIGRLHPGKGHDTTIHAVAQLRREGFNVSLRILGDGPDRDRLTSLITDLRLNDAVHLLGSVDEGTVKGELAAGHIFVLASHAEPLGVAYMEAMATGIPTIGTSAGGVAEIIDDGVTGYLVPPQNPEALADRIRSVLQNGPAALALGLRGRRSIEKRFDSLLGARKLLTAILAARAGSLAPAQA